MGGGTSLEGLDCDASLDENQSPFPPRTPTLDFTRIRLPGELRNMSGKFKFLVASRCFNYLR